MGAEGAKMVAGVQGGARCSPRLRRACICCSQLLLRPFIILIMITTTRQRALHPKPPQCLSQRVGTCGGPWLLLGGLALGKART